jgi:hypothetical protein
MTRVYASEANALKKGVGEISFYYSGKGEKKLQSCRQPVLRLCVALHGWTRDCRCGLSGSRSSRSAGARTERVVLPHAHKN